MNDISQEITELQRDLMMKTFLEMDYKRTCQVRDIVRANRNAYREGYYSNDKSLKNNIELLRSSTSGFFMVLILLIYAIPGCWFARRNAKFLWEKSEQQLKFLDRRAFESWREMSSHNAKINRDMYNS